MELAELEVCEIRAGGVGHHRTRSDRAPGIRRSRPESRGSAGCEDRRSSVDRAMLGDHAVAALAVAPERHRGCLLDYVDPLILGGELRKPLGDSPSRPSAARVDHPPA